MTQIESVRKISYGHWEVIVKKYNYTKSFPIKLSSTTQWKYTTTDSQLIDEYQTDKYARKQLIYMAKNHGSKTIIKQN